MVTLENGNSAVRIDKGELVSFINNGHEFIHQKGSPGWRSSDTEMFPIIGPVDEAGFRVQVAKASAVQDQHGLLRELDYELVSSTATSAVFKKQYAAGTLIENSKFPKKSTEEKLIWPYAFEFHKTFELSEKSLNISFSVIGEPDMPFMLGYHPAFKVHTAHPKIIAGTREIQLDEVLAVGSRALQVADCESITLKDERDITIETEGFGHFMCWTEVPNMVCIEPITFYPYAVDQKDLHNGFQFLENSEAIFKVFLKV